MRQKHLFWIAPWIAFSFGACATLPNWSTTKACAEWRWIGIRSPEETKCPVLPGWESRPLFAPPAYSCVAPDTQVLEQLDRFCVYETDRKSGNVPFPPTASGRLVRVDRDCAAISRAGGTVVAQDWKTLSDQFLAQAGKPDTPLKITKQRGVRLAFLDTHPTGVGAPAVPPQGKGTSEHGYSLAHMARNLICSPEDSDECAAQITTQLALPITKFDPKSRKRTKIDTATGGNVGMQSDLANAIQNEVNAWLQDRWKKDAPQHLVLNLSVAWDGDRFGGLAEAQVAELRAGAQAVYWALRYAAGFDVLVLAAAGNAQDCKKPTAGPLLPAAWERGAPWEETCGGRLAAPLVYAVGGVDSQGQPLVNARQDAMPPRAAYGEYAVAPALTSGQSTNMYTGTSVATAVASSIAAIVWDTLPDRSPKEIMELLESSGSSLPLLADFWFDANGSNLGAAPPVHRLSLCAALRAACKPGEVGCPLQEDCALWTPPDPTYLAAAPQKLNKCNPWVHTQPPDEPCPVCVPPRP